MFLWCVRQSKGFENVRRRCDPSKPNLSEADVEKLTEVIVQFRDELLPLLKGLKASSSHNLVLTEALRVASDALEQVSERPAPWRLGRY